MKRPQYDEPYHWWGPGWTAPTGRSIGDLLRDETIDSGTGAVLWAALSRHMSLAVAAGPSGAGKTTLLTALLDLVPPQTRRLHLRGSFETFAFLSDETVVPSESVLLVNEISAHLPVYLWGPAVSRTLAAKERGFSLLATAHAESVAEFVGALTGSPLRIPATLVAAFDFLVFLDLSGQSPSGRRVREVSRLTRTPSGVAFESMSAPAQDNAHEWFPQQELRERKRRLDDLREGRIATPSLWR
jgi:ABC-type cobalamin/Fe3+-siderophores transport system ATPase subunit